MVYYNRYLWLIVVYLIGAYINRFGYRFLNDLKKSLFSAVLFLFLIIAYIFVVEKGFYPISGKAPTLFWTPNSVLELGLSISVFASFYYINLIKPYRVINYIASCSFGIYLLHDGAAKQYIWDQIYSFDLSQINAVHFAIRVITVALGIFSIGAIIDMIRKQVEKIIIWILDHTFFKNYKGAQK